MISKQIVSSPFFFEALASLLDEIDHMNLSSEEKSRLVKLVQQPDKISAEKILPFIEQFPEIETFIATYIDLRTQKYFNLISDGEVINPGKLMVCPVDPDHYQEYQHSAEETLICPQHETALIVKT